MHFEDALREIKEDPKAGMRLPYWSPETAVYVQYPDANSKMTSPYLYMSNRFGKVPWRETYSELFNNNWEVINI